jgi:hypothetical protein
MVGAKADQHAVALAVSLADQLPDVDQPGIGHVGEPSVTDVGVVLPDHRLDVPTSAATLVVEDEPVQGVGHVGVADVPGLGSAMHHRAVGGLGAHGRPSVLLGGERRVAADVG